MMKDFIVALEEELKELKEKINKLDGFIITAAFEELSSTDRDLLITQVHIMESYYDYLIERLERIRPKKD